MKKTLAVLMAILIVATFAACSSAEYEDTVVTAVVTDENGETVTDENGEVVTEIVSTDSQDDTDADSDDGDSNSAETTASGDSDAESDDGEDSSSTTKKSSSSNSKTTTKKGETTKSAESDNDGDSEETTKATTKTTTTTKKTTTTEEETTKAKKREVTVKVVIPYYNDQQTKLSIRYKVEGDDKYTVLEMEDPSDSKNTLEYEAVTLDGNTVKEYSLGKLKGKVTVKVLMSGIDLSENTAVIEADESSATIKPQTGIEILKGDDD